MVPHFYFYSPAQQRQNRNDGTSADISTTAPAQLYLWCNYITLATMSLSAAALPSHSLTNLLFQDFESWDSKQGTLLVVLNGRINMHESCFLTNVRHHHHLIFTAISLSGMTISSISGRGKTRCVRDFLILLFFLIQHREVIQSIQL